MIHPEHHIGFVFRCEVVQKKEVFKNKEDSHGGPGYYPEEEIVARYCGDLAPGEAVKIINRVARGELK